MSNITKGDNSKSEEGRVVILVRNTLSCPILQFYQVPSKYSEGYSSYRADEKPISNKTKGNNSKSKKTRVVILVHDMSSGPVLPSIIKIFQRVFDLQSRHEINGLSLSNLTKGDNAKSKKGRAELSFLYVTHCLVLFCILCQIPLKYSKGYSSYRADEKSISNKTKGDNSQSKKIRVVILVSVMLSGPVLHFY